jgi:predicted phage baseplate assembly protein
MERELNEDDDECGKEDYSLSECGCCEGIEKSTPATIRNPPGLSSIDYRVGTHSQFKNSMIVSLGQQQNQSAALQNLTTREDNDAAIALFDSWAVIADILTFYQERIANEGFLGTATERRSVLELARTVGYELRPGVAASTFLAFTVDPAAVEKKKTILINAGTKVQSLPGAGETPQVFETMEEIEASAEWNQLKPRLTQRQNISPETYKIHFKGRKTLLKPGDLLMVVQGQGQQQQQQQQQAIPKFLKLVNRVEEDAELDQTIVHVTDPQQRKQQKTKVQTLFVSDFATTNVRFSAIPRKLDLTRIRMSELKQLASYKWTETDFNILGANYDTSASEYADFMNENAEQSQSPANGDTVRVYTFRIRAGIFGNNAPRHDTLPLDSLIKSSYEDDADGERDVSEVAAVSPSSPTTASQTVYLDNNYPSITPSSDTVDSWLLLQSPDVTDGKSHAYQIKDVREETRSKFLVTFKSTGLEISNPNNEDLSGFKVRNTTVFAKSELLELAEVPITQPIADCKTVTLDHALVNRPKKGKLVSISGEIVDTEGNSLGIQRSEIATIDYSELDGVYTALTFTDNLKNRYKRDSFELNANVSRATHGETKGEVVIGGGDPSQSSNQEFTLKESPLTYILASTPTGVASTLEVRVDGILWHEAPSMLSLRADERGYLVRNDEGGQAKIIFGDGIHGLRPASGMENIKAKYRIGLGEVGLVKPGQLSLLMSKPLGVRGVTNPIAPTGAADPENLNSARKNSVLPVLTMERIVSVEDVERFALGFAGVGKSVATLIWDGDKKIIRLTIASAQGDVVEPQSDLHIKLVHSINKHKDPSIRVQIDRFDKKLFNIEASVAVEKDREHKDVFEAIRQTLLTRFSFNAMQFNQPVTLSQVVTTIQSVAGVAAVDVDGLFTINQNAKQKPVLNNNINNKLNSVVPEVLEFRSADNSTIRPAPHDWMITLNSDGLVLREMQL